MYIWNLKGLIKESLRSLTCKQLIIQAH